MIKKVSVVKYNNDFFEHGDLVTVEKNDGTTIIGTIIFGCAGEFHVTTSNELYLDVSEKYHSQKIGVLFNQIKSIKKKKLILLNPFIPFKRYTCY